LFLIHLKIYHKGSFNLNKQRYTFSLLCWTIWKLWLPQCNLCCKRSMCGWMRS